MDGAGMCCLHRVSLRDGGTPAPNAACPKPGSSAAPGLNGSPGCSHWHKCQICPQNVAFPAPSCPTGVRGFKGSPGVLWGDRACCSRDRWAVGVAWGGLAVAVAAVPVGHREFRLPLGGDNGPWAPAWCWISGYGPARGHQRVVAVTVPCVPMAAAPWGHVCHGATAMASHHHAVPEGHAGARGHVFCPSTACRVLPASQHITPCTSPHPTPVTTGDRGCQGTGGFGGGVSSTKPPPRWMLDPGDPEFNPTYGAGRRCPRRRWVVTAEKSPPAGAGEALAVAGGGARPLSRRVGSVTSPQRDGGSRARGRGSLWVPGGPGGTCLSAASVMALGTWQPGLRVPPPLSFKAAAP